MLSYWTTNHIPYLCEGQETADMVRRFVVASAHPEYNETIYLAGLLGALFAKFGSFRINGPSCERESSWFNNKLATSELNLRGPKKLAVIRKWKMRMRMN